MTEEEEEDDWYSQLELQREREREQSRKAFAEACGPLGELGVTHVCIKYDGYGDEGSIENIKAVNESGECQLPDKLETALTAAAESLLPDGWENGCGTFGDIVLDVAARRLLLEYNQRFEDFETNEEQWEL